MRYLTVLVSFVVLAAGCQTGAGIHTIPVTRDYAHLEKANLEGAADGVRAAHARGAASSAPYEYFSAVQYLAIARDSARLGDRAAMRDYAALARQMSEAAIRKCPEQAAEPPAPADSYEECQAKFQELKTEYVRIDREKAIRCAPMLYASLTATLSRAEHTLTYPDAYARADKALNVAKADLDAIVRQDADDDRIPDLQDADPRLPEDFDSHQDDDGAPDPDNDHDGIADKTDVQPNDPETVNGYKDHDGAPDQLPVLQPVVFAENGSELSGEVRGYLTGVKELLAEWPRLRLRVTGRGNISQAGFDAMDLSRVRAENVRRCLLDHGVPERQLVVTFTGASGPEPENARVDLQLE